MGRREWRVHTDGVRVLKVTAVGAPTPGFEDITFFHESGNAYLDADDELEAFAKVTTFLQNRNKKEQDNGIPQ